MKEVAADKKVTPGVPREKTHSSDQVVAEQFRLKDGYPRVLIVYMSCLNKADQHGLSLRSWFAEWPRENLAQIYSGGEVGTERFCGLNFKIGFEERRFGQLFFKLKASSIGESAFPVTLLEGNLNRVVRSTISSRAKRMFGMILLNSGIWELIFRPRLSRDLMEWVRNFQPEIIYCQGYSLTFSRLPLMLQEYTSAPICFQTGDDWPRYCYSNSVLSRLMNPILQHSAKRLVRAASVRFSSGVAMSQAYANRYCRHFEPLMMCDDIERFNSSEPKHLVGSEKLSVVYAGSLGSHRWRPLLDLCTAAHELRDEGMEIVLTALVSGLPPEARQALKDVPNLQLLAVPNHEALPAYLKGSDLLFLPESFEIRQAKSIQLSISTKAHLYMMSERPVLIYAPPISGIVGYARETGWGCVVDRQEHNLLKSALKNLLLDEAYRHELVAKGREVALQSHDSTVVRERIRHVLCAAAKKQPRRCS